MQTEIYPAAPGRILELQVDSVREETKPTPTPEIDIINLNLSPQRD